LAATGRARGRRLAGPLGVCREAARPCGLERLARAAEGLRRAARAGGSPADPIPLVRVPRAPLHEAQLWLERFVEQSAMYGIAAPPVDIERLSALLELRARPTAPSAGPHFDRLAAPRRPPAASGPRLPPLLPPGGRLPPPPPRGRPPRPPRSTRSSRVCTSSPRRAGKGWPTTSTMWWADGCSCASTPTDVRRPR